MGKPSWIGWANADAGGFVAIGTNLHCRLVYGYEFDIEGDETVNGEYAKRRVVAIGCPSGRHASC